MHCFYIRLEEIDSFEKWRFKSCWRSWSTLCLKESTLWTKKVMHSCYQGICALLSSEMGAMCNSFVEGRMGKQGNMENRGSRVIHQQKCQRFAESSDAWLATAHTGSGFETYNSAAPERRTPFGRDAWIRSPPCMACLWISWSGYVGIKIIRGADQYLT